MIEDLKKTYQTAQDKVKNIEGRLSTLHSSIKGYISNFESTATKISILTEELKRYELPVDLLDILDKLYADSSKVISACKNFKDQLENNDDLSI